MLIDRHYRGILNYVQCPTTGESIRFSHVDTSTMPFVFYYVVENSDITYNGIGYSEDKNTVYTSSDGKYYLLRGNELIRSVLTSSGIIENSNIFKLMKYDWIPRILRIFKKKSKYQISASLTSNDEIEIKPMSSPSSDLYYLTTHYFDYPHISSINIGDILILDREDQKIEIIVKKVSESLIISTKNSIYDLSEWKYSRKLNV